MSNEDFYFTIENPGQGEYKDRGSKFLASALPIHDVADFKRQLLKLKEIHPKAAHHCFAYRLGTDGNNFRSSDDGEPSGTAGKPILGQIDSKQLTNIAVIVVRYFGGTLLGVPGLINAYKTAAALALQSVPIATKAVEVNYRLQFDYTAMNEVMKIVKKYECRIIKQQTELFCIMDIGIPKNRVAATLPYLKEIKGIQLVEIQK